jgi:thioesterase domain-containing protein
MLGWRSFGTWARSARKLVRGALRSPGAPTDAAGAVAHADDLFDVSGWPEHLRRRVEHHLRLLESFEYGRYDGEVVLLRARVRPLLHAHSRDLGWGALAARVRVIDVPGNHVTMTAEPHVRQVAEKLGAVLDAAMRRA